MLRRILSSPFHATGLPVLAAGLVVTLVLFNGTYRLEQEKADLDFREQAEMYIANVRQGFIDAIAGLHALNLLFATVTTVSPGEFRSFTRPLLQRYPYIEAFSFHRLVPFAERRSFENALRKRIPGYTILEQRNNDELVPAGPRPQYLPLVYLEPAEKHGSRLGFDALSQPQRADVTWRAIDTGLPSATDIMEFAVGASKRPMFFVISPVYRRGMPLTNVNTRRQAAIGAIHAVFYADDLIAKTLSKGLSPPANLSINVYTAATPVESELAYSHGRPPESSNRDMPFPWNLFIEQPQTVAQTFEVGGTPWHMVVSGPPTVFFYGHRGSLLILFFGTLLSLGAASVRHTAAARSQRIERLVEQRTAELSRTGQDLKLRQRAIEASANAIIITSAQGPDFPIEYVNPAFERITGFSVEEATGKHLHMLCGKDLEQPGAIEINAALRDGSEGHAILRQYRRDGTQFWSDFYIAPVMDENGQPKHFVIMLYDITEMKRYEAELEFQANYDTLTGLANRNLLRDRLTQALTVAARYNHRVCVAFLDLDRFKFVNDSLGHQAGDVFLATIAQRLKQAVRDTDTVAHYGSDEFVLVLPEYENGDASVKVMQGVMQAISQPILLDGKELFPTCSVGMAIYPNDGKDAETLLTQADVAMYSAKESGRNRFQFYAPKMNERTARRLRLEGDLRRALDRHELLLQYQPQIEARSGRIVGMETLIRWRHPEFGLLPPASFISLAEETGLIVPIGEWVIRTACAQAKKWERAGFGDLRMAINLSARQFTQLDLVQLVANALADTGLAAKCIELEITESMVMADVAHAIDTLHKLKSLDVQLSIDDFGTGFSSLSYLKRFPIDVLKVDQSFVRDITSDADDAMIVVSIIALAHNLRLKVIAEGVETVEQLAYLRDHECDLVQGYYFSHPLPADALEEMLQKTVNMHA